MRKLVLGCGYLGARVAERWLAAGDVVMATTRSMDRAKEFETLGLQPIVADVTQPETLAQLPAVDTVLWAVGFDRRGGHSRRAVYVDGLQNVLDLLPTTVGRFIFIGSTGVYADAGGDWIDEDSPCRPTREAGQTLLAAEQLLGSHRLGSRSVILRLAGLYGPGRLPRVADLQKGNPIEARAGSWLNLIHVDDAAAVVLAAEGVAKCPAVYGVSDGNPVDRREFLRGLAELLRAPAPRFIEPSPERLASHHSGSNKRVSNARMLAELDVHLTYPTFREGLAGIVRGDFCRF
jgi:nucleoside-diphosphate-sugar epimerase